MAESAAAGGYTLNTVSVSEATQHSTNNISQGMVSFGDYSKGGFTTKQMIAVGAVLLVGAFLFKRKG